jgi:hypothetical protein
LAVVTHDTLPQGYDGIARFSDNVLAATAADPALVTLTGERCARWGVPYFMRVEIVRRLQHVSVELLALTDGADVQAAEAVAGQRLRATVPFEIDFDPRELLP